MSRENDVNSEAESLLCRFLKGDLPLFALEAWLNETDNALPDELRRQFDALDWHANDLRTRLENQIEAFLPTGQADLWLLKTILPWILSEEARASRAVALCWQLQSKGLDYLAPIGLALCEGFDTDESTMLPRSPWDPDSKFDWERVKRLIPDLKPAASLILEILNQHPQSGPLNPALFTQEPAKWLISTIDWRKSNQAIASWQKLTLLPTAKSGPIASNSNLLEQALAAASQQQWSQAESLLARLLESNPKHAGAFHLFGLIYQAKNQLDSAITCFEQALKLGGSAEIRPILARLHHDQGNLMAARQDYLAALNSGFQLEDQDLHRYGHCLRESGEAGEALEIYQNLLAHYPQHAALWMHKGNAHFDLGQYDAALSAYRHSLELAPENALAHFNNARILAHLGQSDAADAALQHCLALDSNLVPAWNLLGSLEQSKGRNNQALSAFQQALKRQPDDAASLNNLGVCYQALYQGEAAEAAYKESLRLAPEMVEARINLAQLMRERNLPEAAQITLASLLSQHPRLEYAQAFVLPIVARNTDAPTFWLKKLSNALCELESHPEPIQDPLRQIGRLPFYAAYLSESDRETQEQLARVFLKACPDLKWEAAHCKQPRKPGPWRIGLISGFYYAHTVWHLFGYLLTGLKQCGHVVTALYTGNFEDQVTEAARKQADVFIKLPRDYAQARDCIARQELDLLLFLDASMDPVSYFLGFARLAPIQCNTWGHGVTSGLPEMDIFLSCPGFEAETDQNQYSELLHLLPGFFGHWQNPEFPDAKPADFGLPPGRYYLCPQSLYKFHPSFDAILAEILARDPAAHLVMIEGLYPEWREHLMARWAGKLDIQRVCWVKRLSHQEYLRLLSVGDVMLETRPFGSGLTMLQALSQGLPVVTWPTDVMKGRIAYGICQELNWYEGVANSAEDYVGRAISLARSWVETDKQALRQLYAERLLPEKMAGQMSAALTELCERKFNGQP